MQNARFLLDLFTAVVALAAPFLDTATPVAKATGLIELLGPRTLLRRKSLAKKPLLKPNRLRRHATYTVTATVYEAVPGQTDDEPFVTADNSRIKPHYGSKKRWMALSRDLLKPWGGKFEYGDIIHVSGISPELDGIYTVHDTMNRRHRHCMDVLVHPSEHFDGLWKGVKIRKVSLE